MRALSLLTPLQLQAMVSTEVNMGLFPSHSFVVASYGFNIGKMHALSLLTPLHL
jgi:hypothetical protein